MVTILKERYFDSHFILEENHRAKRERGGIDIYPIVSDGNINWCN